MKNDVTSRRIAVQNDAFRCQGWDFVMTCGVSMLPDVPGLVERVRLYDDFNEDNDLYQTHDFGNVSWHGQSIFWKIDYYTPDLSAGERPSSPDCRRILTIMLASDY